MKQSRFPLAIGLAVEAVKIVLLYLWFVTVADTTLPGPGRNLLFFVLAAPQLLFAAAFILQMNFPSRYGILKNLLIAFKAALVGAALALALVGVLGSYSALNTLEAWIPAFPALGLALLDLAGILTLKTFVVETPQPELPETEVQPSEGQV